MDSGVEAGGWKGAQYYLARLLPFLGLAGLAGLLGYGGWLLLQRLQDRPATPLFAVAACFEEQVSGWVVIEASEQGSGAGPVGSLSIYHEPEAKTDPDELFGAVGECAVEHAPHLAGLNLFTVILKAARGVDDGEDHIVGVVTAIINFTRTDLQSMAAADSPNQYVTDAQVSWEPFSESSGPTFTPDPAGLYRSSDEIRQLLDQ